MGNPVGHTDWATVYEQLSVRDGASLTAQELETLADAAWWLCRVEESLAARQRAYQEYLAAGDDRRASYTAWMLSTEYQFTGRSSASAGWLERAKRHVQAWPECVEHAFVLYGEAEVAERNGDVETALQVAERMTAVGRRCRSRDVIAMGQQLEGRLLVARGQLADGMARLDEAMCDVLAGELSDAITGWIFCVAVGVCYDTADLRRAAEWNDAAMTWCATLPAGTPYRGMCRVHRADLLGLGGELAQADAEADTACRELLAYHPHMAAEAYYVAGEIRRRRGDHAAAEDAFRRAHEYGREPQPGLALVRLAQGRTAEAAAALRSCLATGEWPLLGRARLLAALVEVALAAGDLDAARAAADELAALGDTGDAVLLRAESAAARGAVDLATGEIADALAQLRHARGLWLELGMPYEVARTRTRLAAASRAAGDSDTARLELHAARAGFVRLGAADDLRRVDELLAAEDHLPGNLTRREVEVLRLVAAGRTNRDIATELVISPHTVGRHLNNIFVKLGVTSRAAATAFAYAHDLAESR
ncbi:MAG: LuxR C-terminal-related transcriptional regulator [Actinomycetota bacterium]